MIIQIAEIEPLNYQIMNNLNTSTEATITYETAIGFIPCYSNTFIKVCTRCGLDKKSTDYGKDKTSKSGLRSYCKNCGNEMRKDWIKRNKNKEKEYNVKYRPKTIEKYKERQFAKQENNKCLKCGCSLIGMKLLARYCKNCKIEIIKDLKRKSYKRNIDTVIKYRLKNIDLINKKNREFGSKSRENLTDRYIKKLLREKGGFTADQLKNNPELIEIKRLIIKTKRL